MKVEIWSDIVCPFCYIGKRRFEAGLHEFAQRDEVEIVHRSFELDPTIPIHPEKTLFEIAAAKYGTTPESTKKDSIAVTERAKKEGLVFNYETVKHTNSMDSHRLILFAREFGKEEVVLESLYRAYFTDSLHIGERDTLLSIAEQAGLDRQETANMLDSDRYREAVREDERTASKLGIRGVPFYLIDGKYAVSGAQSADVFTEALQKAWEERRAKEKETVVEDDAGMCTDGFC
ncbi:DSBA oxidoreductase [Paenibacillus glycanilyticus]|uniref:DSBA oxidoreductase n=1 Tax=Paenibacillus glycanilyticus TaxID=126569 RepID=A0ABQ6NTD3_9BACL|nr:DsbA family oxidoreductase [Paenibacillus glycanilyticus]GMK47467.1 DSBA oxidoreductase [Paenibacillus glycanilyticus]